MTSPTSAPETRFIGISAVEFLEHAEHNAKSGKFSDGTEIKPQVREALGVFTKSLAAQRAKWRHYVFVWSRHVFIIIDF